MKTLHQHTQIKKKGCVPKPPWIFICMWKNLVMFNITIKHLPVAWGNKQLFHSSPFFLPLLCFIYSSKWNWNCYENKGKKHNLNREIKASYRLGIFLHHSKLLIKTVKSSFRQPHLWDMVEKVSGENSNQKGGRNLI